jgi:polysaccharide biosynthesis protein VpsQ
MRIRRVHVALVVFASLLGALVVLADSGRGRHFFALAALVPAGDKLGHFVLFGILSFLVNLVLRATVWRPGKLILLKGSVVVLSIVSVEEFTQLFFRSRTFDLLDLLAGGLGVWLCGKLAANHLRWKRSRPTGPAAAEAASGQSRALAED